MDSALLILRVVGGLLVAGPGAQKLFGWFGGGGTQGAAGGAAARGFRPPQVGATTAGLVEFGGGLLLALGLFNPLGTIAIAASMTMAIVKVHWPKIWVSEGGMELPVVYLSVALAVVITGPGAFSLDQALGTGLSPTLSIIAALVILAGWIWGFAGARAAAAAKALFSGGLPGGGGGAP